MFGSNDVMARLAWVTMMGLVEIGMGHRMVGWFFWVLLYSWSWLGFAFPSPKFLTQFTLTHLNQFTFTHSPLPISTDSPSPISIAEASHGLSLISHRGLASCVWISGLGSVDGGFETMDLLIGGWIGWIDHR